MVMLLAPFTSLIGKWMSKNLELLFKSVRKQKDESAKNYNPISNLRILHETYPGSCIYLAMLGFKKSWRYILPDADLVLAALCLRSIEIAETWKGIDMADRVCNPWVGYLLINPLRKLFEDPH